MWGKITAPFINALTKNSYGDLKEILSEGRLDALPRLRRTMDFNSRRKGLDQRGTVAGCAELDVATLGRDDLLAGRCIWDLLGAGEVRDSGSHASRLFSQG